MARLIHQNLRGSQFIVIPDAAHISNIEQPEFFNRELLKFLAQQQA
jgi:pimeloyl-ACP methyl ester carboxylesterase